MVFRRTINPLDAAPGTSEMTHTHHIEILADEVWRSISRLQEAMVTDPNEVDKHAPVLWEAQKKLFRIIHRLKVVRAA